MVIYLNDWRLTHHIYSLINPLDGSTFYVGKTFIGADVRLGAHLAEAKNRPPGSNEKKNDIIENILKSGGMPELKILAQIQGTCKVDAYMAGQLELNYIRDMAKEGHPLVNIRGIKEITYYHWQKYLDSQVGGFIDLSFYESFILRGMQYHDLISIDQETKRLSKIPKEGTLGFFVRYGESRYGIVDSKGNKIWLEHELKMAYSQ